ncbi:MAG: MerR family transcriptional regulator [Dehalococcoidia bacterium]|nr:MAG: MerR family transcriptional regulator [Dehalococcoidia bacterium]
MKKSDDQALRSDKLAKYTMAVTVSLTSVEAHRIRRYEHMGLLRPLRSDGGQRLFTNLEVELISEIARLESKKINLEGVKAILAMRHGEEI